MGPHFEYLEEEEAVVNSEDGSELDVLGAKQLESISYAATLSPTKAKNNQGPHFEEEEAVVDSEDDSEPEALLQYAARIPSSNVEYLEEEEVADNEDELI